MFELCELKNAVNFFRNGSAACKDARRCDEKNYVPFQIKLSFFRFNLG